MFARNARQNPGRLEAVADHRIRRNLLILAFCACAIIFSACASQESKDDKGDQRQNKVGAEDFMPERTRIVYVRSCESCHGPDGHGITAVAPNLYRAKHRSAEEWEKYLRESADAHPVGHQAPLWLDPDEIKEMSEFLETVTRQNL